jgi:hypothetical protein
METLPFILLLYKSRDRRATTRLHGDEMLNASHIPKGGAATRASHATNLLRLLALPALLLSLNGAVFAQTTVQAWITTGDQTQLLARGADARFKPGAKAATIIEVDPGSGIRKWSASAPPSPTLPPG